MYKRIRLRKENEEYIRKEGHGTSELIIPNVGVELNVSQSIDHAPSDFPPRLSSFFCRNSRA